MRARFREFPVSFSVFLGQKGQADWIWLVLTEPGESGGRLGPFTSISGARSLCVRGIV